MATIRVKSDISGMISKIVAKVGDQVAEDDVLILLESMKMGIPLTAPRAGRVTAISAVEGETVAEGEVLVHLES